MLSARPPRELDEMQQTRNDAVHTNANARTRLFWRCAKKESWTLRFPRRVSLRAQSKFGADAPVDAWNNVSVRGLMLLHYACLGNNPKTVKRLLDAGACVDALTASREPAVFTATWANQPAVLKILLDCGANPNISANPNVTALKHAQWQKKAECVRLLEAAMKK